MDDWRETLRDYILPLEVGLAVVAVVALAFVVVARRKGNPPLPPRVAWLLAAVLAVNVGVAMATELWVGAWALVLMLVAVIAAALLPGKASSQSE